jgi:hypothetical protein
MGCPRRPCAQCGEGREGPSFRQPRDRAAMATRLPLRWKPVRADDRMLTSGGSTWLLPPRQGRCHGGTGLPWKFWFLQFLVSPICQRPPRPQNLSHPSRWMRQILRARRALERRWMRQILMARELQIKHRGARSPEATNAPAARRGGAFATQERGRKRLQ